MYKLGLKLWSKNILEKKNVFMECVESVKNGEFSYIELMTIPGTFQETKAEVKSLCKDIRVEIHAAHDSFGLDTGNKDNFSRNKKLIEEARNFADLLGSEIIITHAGCGVGERYLAETVRQFKSFDDKRITVENLPQQCLEKANEYHGINSEEIKRIIDETGCKFCFDISHATCSAVNYKKDIFAELKKYAALNPAIYHLCDGDVNSTVDKHLHFGQGNYDLRRIMQEIIPSAALISMETGEAPQSITPWLKDKNYLQTL